MYVERLTSATTFRYGRADAFVDVDPRFYAARYLRAWQLQALINETLVERYDVDWWRNPRAGPWICSALFGEGQRELAHEQAERVVRQGAVLRAAAPFRGANAELTVTVDRARGLGREVRGEVEIDSSHGQAHRRRHGGVSRHRPRDRQAPGRRVRHRRRGALRGPTRGVVARDRRRRRIVPVGPDRHHRSGGGRGVAGRDRRPGSGEQRRHGRAQAAARADARAVDGDGRPQLQRAVRRDARRRARDGRAAVGPRGGDRVDRRAEPVRGRHVLRRDESGGQQLRRIADARAARASA